MKIIELSASLPANFTLHSSKTSFYAKVFIAYNTIILNTLYEKMLKEGVHQKIIEEFARISPIAWGHIVFTGKYNFKKSKGNIDVEAMVSTLEKHLKQHFWKGT